VPQLLNADEGTGMFHHKLLSVAGALLALLTMPTGTLATPVTPEPKVEKAPPEIVLPEPGAYQGLGTWIDMFDVSPWKYPEKAIDRMAERGVRTLYLQTSNWQKSFPIYKPDVTARLIDQAHLQGIKVVAWYLPSFTNLRKDFRRTRAAVDFTTATGNKFDSFALDIEATEVRDVSERSRRAMSLSQRIRDYVGADYELGAIIPDPAGQVYWPGYPYAETAAIYDAILPMGYYTYRVDGYRATYRYAKRNVTIIRREAGDDVAVHAIGGIAGRATKREVQAFIDGSRAAGISGLSLYDFPITLEWEWTKLTR
jgi:hypothetical protein